MRSIQLWSVGALLLGASTTGCYRQSSEQPIANTRAPAPTAEQPQAPSTVVTRRGDEILQRGERKGVTAAQPGTPAAQPSTPPSDDRARAAQIVALASRQIERLTRIAETADPERRSELDSTIGDLQSRREKVLQDMRELELRGPTSEASTSDRLRSELDRDLNDLRMTLRDSFDIAPPPGQGMPPPAPLPPEDLP
ncbi:MAG TPA: hypothetical protein VMI75_35515 [Polyangiaceae bacterium]|nr:hypothetical protein [Polyangiaceae bacterium]